MKQSTLVINNFSNMSILEKEKLESIYGGDWRDWLDNSCTGISVGSALLAPWINTMAFFAPAAFCAGWLLGGLIDE